MTQPQPLETIRVGGVKATIWENESEGGNKFPSITLVRTYMDKEGNWQESTSYLGDQLPKLILAAQKAYEFINLRESTLGKDQPETHQEKLKKERSGAKAK